MIARNAVKMMFIFCTLLFAITVRAETTVDKEGRFSVNFPGPAKQQVQNVDTAVGKVAIHVTFQDAGTIAYMIIYNDYPPETKFSFQGAIDGGVKNVKGTLRSQAPYKLGDIEGIEFIADGPKSETVFRVRYFYVGSRLYQAMYDGPHGTETSKAATDFLDSFRVLP